MTCVSHSCRLSLIKTGNKSHLWWRVLLLDVQRRIIKVWHAPYLHMCNHKRVASTQGKVGNTLCKEPGKAECNSGRTLQSLYHYRYLGAKKVTALCLSQNSTREAAESGSWKQRNHDVGEHHHTWGCFQMRRSTATLPCFAFRDSPFSSLTISTFSLKRVILHKKMTILHDGAQSKTFVLCCSEDSSTHQSHFFLRFLLFYRKVNAHSKESDVTRYYIFIPH